MNRFCIAVTLVVFGAIAQSSHGSTLLNVAIPEGDLGITNLVIAVDNNDIGTMQYKDTLEIDADGNSELQVFHPNSGELLASTSLARNCINNVEPCSPLFVIFGGSNGRIIQVKPIEDNIPPESIRCTQEDVACDQTLNFAPIPKPDNSPDSVFVRKRCGNGSVNGGSFSRSVSAGERTYGKTTRVGGGSTSGIPSNQRVLCSLEGITQAELGYTWPELDDFEIPRGTTGRFILIGESEHHPLEVLTMIDTTIVDSGPSSVDPNKDLSSAITWFDPERAGHGAVVDISPDGLTATVIEYFFDEAGQARWRYLHMIRVAQDPVGVFSGSEYSVTRNNAEVEVLPLLNVSLTMREDRIELVRAASRQTYLAQRPVPDE